jgi:hypothetical protein
VAPFRFTARIGIAGINPFVSVPEDIRRALGGTGNIPVKGTVNGFSFRSTLVPVRKGPYRLYVNMDMRKGSGADTGDTVEIILGPDTMPRHEPIPGLLEQALELHPGARAAWNALVPSRRRAILRYLNSLKGRDALGRNVEKVIQVLEGE